jgi:hypothetical protein
VTPANPQLKQDTDVPNRWLAERLGMGSACYVSKLVGLARKREPSSSDSRRATEKARGGPEVFWLFCVVRGVRNSFARPSA